MASFFCSYMQDSWRTRVWSLRLTMGRYPSRATSDRCHHPLKLYTMDSRNHSYEPYHDDHAYQCLKHQRRETVELSTVSRSCTHDRSTFFPKDHFFRRRNISTLHTRLLIRVKGWRLPSVRIKTKAIKIFKNQNPTTFQRWGVGFLATHLGYQERQLMAPRPGFEPGYTAPEAVVLPLDDLGMVPRGYRRTCSGSSKHPHYKGKGV